MTKQYIFDLAVHVFGSSKIAGCWMMQSLPELDGKCPAELLESAEGVAHVGKILSAIEMADQVA